MPTKRTRQARHPIIGEKEFPLDSLSIVDILCIHAGGPPSRTAACDSIKTLDDLEKAWQQNRDSFLRVCTCRGGRACTEHHLKMRPGTRPWAFWKFDMGMDGDDIPRSSEDQFAELKRRKLLSLDELGELAILDQVRRERLGRT